MRPSKWTAGCVLLHDFLEKGNTLLDKSGFKNNGTVYGAVFSPPLGYFEFDGVDDSITIQHNDIFNPHHSNFSIAFWFRTTGTGTHTVICKSTGASPKTDYGWLAVISGGNVKFFTATGGTAWGDTGSFYIVTSNTYNDGNWHSCVISVNRMANGRVKIYIDGKNVGASRGGNITTVGDINNTLPVTIGMEADNQYYYVGDLKNVCFYDRALTFIDAKNFDKGFIPLDGLIAIWKLDKTVNGYVVDLPTRKYWGTISGCTLHTTHEMLYNARYFDGTDDYVEIPDSSVLEDVGNGQFSLATWFKTKNPNLTSWQQLLRKDGRYLQTITTGGLEFGFYNGSEWIVTHTPAILEANKWYFFVGTWDGEYLRIYLNGDLVTEEYNGPTSPVSADGVSVYLGSASANVRWLYGYMAEAIIFNRLLSEDEILAHSRNARFLPVR